MPIYDYKCHKCSHEKEVVVLSGLSDSIWCDKCGGTMQKVMSAPAVVYEYRAIKCEAAVSNG